MADTPRGLLAEADRARSEARSKRRAEWFPLLVFGIVALASTPLYRLTDRVTRPDGTSVLTYGSRWTSWYWLVAIPVGYAACVLFARRRASRVGVAGPVWPYVATGLGLFALMSLVPPGIVTAWTPGFARSWTALPLVALVAGFVVLARLDHNPALLVLAFGVLGVAALIDTTYDVVFGWQGLSSAGFAAIVTGTLLLLAGAIMWMARGRAA